MNNSRNIVGIVTSLNVLDYKLDNLKTLIKSKQIEKLQRTGPTEIKGVTPDNLGKSDHKYTRDYSHEPSDSNSHNEKLKSQKVAEHVSNPIYPQDQNFSQSVANYQGFATVQPEYPPFRVAPVQIMPQSNSIMYPEPSQYPAYMPAQYVNGQPISYQPPGPSYQHITKSEKSRDKVSTQQLPQGTPDVKSAPVVTPKVKEENKPVENPFFNPKSEVPQREKGSISQLMEGLDFSRVENQPEEYKATSNMPKKDLMFMPFNDGNLD